MKIKKAIILFIGLFGITLFSGFNFLQNENILKSDKDIFELVVRKVKKNENKSYQKAYDDYFKEIGKHDGFVKNKEFVAFYPSQDLDKTDVYVGITQWESLKQYGNSSESLMRSALVQNYFSSFTFESYIHIIPADNKEFDFESVSVKSEKVLEILIYKENKGYNKSKQENYINELLKQKGLIFTKNFNSVADNTKVILTYWDTKTTYNNSNDNIQLQQLKKEFYSTIKIKSHYATQNK